MPIDIVDSLLATGANRQEERYGEAKPRETSSAEVLLRPHLR